MKTRLLVALSLTFASLYGCNKEQQAEAGSKAEQARQQMNAAAKTTKERISDASITVKVKGAMNASDKLDTSNISVETKDRVTRLKGLVSSADQKTLAERIARDTVGNDVKVISELAVRPKVAAKEVK